MLSFVTLIVRKYFQLCGCIYVGNASPGTRFLVGLMFNILILYLYINNKLDLNSR
jgi:hypothetical protein